MYTEQYCDDYYCALIKLNPVYVWGANMEKATPELMNKLLKAYGNKTYNATYYQNKLAEAQKGSGWVSDCSGMIFPISAKDNNAKGYYANCPEKGAIGTIDLSHSCLVFRGTTPEQITHIGYYCARTGEVMEMASSKANFQHKKFNKINWNYWGKPKFIQYASSSESVAPKTTDASKNYLYKAIDVSGYQTQINYAACKRLGINRAILKIIRKDMNKDKMFEQHWKGFTEAGIPIYAVYNYSYATNVNKAREDAECVVKALAGRKVPVCLDVEDKCQMGLNQYLISIINTYHSVIEAAGLPFIVYTGLSFYNSYIKPYASELKCKNLWIARYYKGYNHMAIAEDPNTAYKPMNNIIGWQYTSSGILEGMPGTYDLNVIYSDIKTVTPSVTPTVKTLTVRVRTSGSTLNVREKPVNGSVLRKLKHNTIVNICGVDQASGWYQLANGGYVCPDYIQSTLKGTVLANGLNARSGAGTSYPVQNVLKKNEQIVLLNQDKETKWWLTPKGWVSGNPSYIFVD